MEDAPQGSLINSSWRGPPCLRPEMGLGFRASVQSPDPSTLKLCTKGFEGDPTVDSLTY